VSTLTSRPLSCDATRSYAEAFLNDSIDANTKKRVEVHLAGCPPCRKYYASQEDRNLTALAE
jgi:predicted anti-sigma-YlaC factor YlaD